VSRRTERGDSAALSGDKSGCVNEFLETPVSNDPPICDCCAGFAIWCSANQSNVLLVRPCKNVFLKRAQLFFVSVCSAVDEVEPVLRLR